MGSPTNVLGRKSPAHELRERRQSPRGGEPIGREGSFDGGAFRALAGRVGVGLGVPASASSLPGGAMGFGARAHTRCGPGRRGSFRPSFHGVPPVVFERDIVFAPDSAANLRERPIRDKGGVVYRAELA